MSTIIDWDIVIADPVINSLSGFCRLIGPT
jgi:hypothetical protein